MRHSETNRRPSGGFTLVELLVVIGILVILMGLLISAVVKVRRVGPRTQTRAEIAQLEIAIEEFKHTHQVGYIPSGLVLSSNYNMSNPAHRESVQFLSKIWPKGAGSYTLPAGTDQNTGQPVTEFILDGNQLLVFLLGGIPPGPNLNGTDSSLNEVFSNSPGAKYQYPFPPYFSGNRSGFYNSPTQPLNQLGSASGGVKYGAVGTGDLAKGPFFDFKVDRIMMGGHYVDYYGTPYLYFSSKNGNDYQVFGQAFGAGNGGTVIPTYQANGGWGPTPTAPLVGLDGKYLKPNGFQIISAGPDKMFGAGGVYNPGIGEYSPGARGGDDLSNVVRGSMGSE